MIVAEAGRAVLQSPVFVTRTIAAIAGVFLAVVGGCAPWGPLMAPDATTGFIDRAITVDGTEYKYAIYVPRGADHSRGTARPLVVFLHGSGECGTDGSKQLAVGLAPAIMLEPARWPCIAIFPQKPTQKAQWEDHDAAVMAMVAETAREYSIDQSKIYLTGLSQGGHGSWEIGAAHPETWAAVAPLCGYGDPASIAARWKSTPVWAFHGLKDDVVPPAQTEAIVAALKAAGHEAKYTALPEESHNCWDKAYRDPALAQWLFAQRRN